MNHKKEQRQAALLLLLVPAHLWCPPQPISHSESLFSQPSQKTISADLFKSPQPVSRKHHPQQIHKNSVMCLAPGSTGVVPLGTAHPFMEPCAFVLATEKVLGHLRKLAFAIDADDGHRNRSHNSRERHCNLLMNR